MNAD
jgi:hypothetical protein